MRRLVKWTFYFEDNQVEELKELSKKSKVPQAVFVREALDYILKKYRYFLTMKKFDPEEARYYLSKSRGVDAEEKASLSALAFTHNQRKKKEENPSSKL